MQIACFEMTWSLCGIPYLMLIGGPITFVNVTTTCYYLKAKETWETVESKISQLSFFGNDVRSTFFEGTLTSPISVGEKLAWATQISTQGLPWVQDLGSSWRLPTNTLLYLLSPILIILVLWHYRRWLGFRRPNLVIVVYMRYYVVDDASSS